MSVLGISISHPCANFLPNFFTPPLELRTSRFFFPGKKWQSGSFDIILEKDGPFPKLMSHGGVDKDEVANRRRIQRSQLARDHHDHGHGMVIIMDKYSCWTHALNEERGNTFISSTVSTRHRFLRAILSRALKYSVGSWVGRINEGLVSRGLCSCTILPRIT